MMQVALAGLSLTVVALVVTLVRLEKRTAALHRRATQARAEVAQAREALLVYRAHTDGKRYAPAKWAWDEAARALAKAWHQLT